MCVIELVDVAEMHEVVRYHTDVQSNCMSPVVQHEPIHCIAPVHTVYNTKLRHGPNMEAFPQKCMDNNCTDTAIDSQVIV